MFKSNSIRGILIAAVIAVVTLHLFFYFYLYPSITEFVMANTEQDAVRLARHLSSMFIGEVNELKNYSLPPALGKEADKLKSDFNLMKIKIFSPDGEIIYSTDMKDIGDINRNGYFHDIVTNGNTFTKLVKKNTRSLEGQIIPVDVIETYVPVTRSGKLVGAFEIYYDITGKISKIGTFLSHTSTVAFIVTFGLLFAVIAGSVKAKRSINQRNRAEEELRNHRDKLDTLVKDRTSKLVDINHLLEKEIIDRKQAEEKLRLASTQAQEEKAKLESILEAIGDAISIQDRNYNILYQNEAHKNLVGNHVGHYCYKAYQGRDTVCNPCHIAMAFEDGKTHLLEQTRTVDSRKLYYEITGSPLRNASGEIIAGIEVVRDITHRRNIEELIEESKQDWEDTFDTIDDIITIHDKDFNIIRANKAAEKTFGMSFKELIGKKCFICFHGMSNPPDNCPSCESLRTGQSMVFEHFEPHLNKFLEIRTLPRHDADNEIVGLIHVVRDITDRKRIEDELLNHRNRLEEMVEEKTSDLTAAIDLLNNEITHRRQAEEALRISEKKYRNLYNNAPDMYHTLNKDKIVIDCNETEARMLGYKKEEIIGRPIADFLTEESRQMLEQDFPLIQKNKALYNLKRTFIRKDGSTFPAILNTYTDFDEKGEFVCTRSIARDITEIKRAEEEALRAAHLASLGELAAGVAHEINNPINGIINYAELLSKKISSGGKEIDITRRIIKEGDRIANIVRSLLSFARNTKEEKKPVSVHEILSDTLSLTETQLHKDGIHLSIVLPHDLPLLFAHHQQIEQVFLNVMSNARYALNAKFPGVHSDKILKIEAQSMKNGDTKYVRIIFYDHGTGIPDNVKDKIMNPFFSTKPGAIGTGLGLSISHGIISNHNGNIYVESKYGRFTKIIIDLPAHSKKLVDEK